jgi:eukaryotic-like serine/threonine-protein kinase
MPQPDQTCLTPALMREHLKGTLSAHEQRQVIAHLDTCAICRESLERLASEGDALLAVARDIGREPAVGAWSGHHAPAPGHDTPAHPGLASTPDAHVEGRGEADTVSLDFLAPAEKPGELGRLGHYAVTEVIGQGGMGIVLKAVDQRLQRVVAIKVMAPQLAASTTARKRFIREAQAAAAVRNEHVIDVHEVNEAGGLPYLVMEYICGISLEQKLVRAGALDVARVLRIGMQTAAGLAAAHAQGLVHRDIKPANILLENGVERVKITDFGLARAADDAGLTQTGVVAGTPQYMAPEQARADAVDQRADLFSLGSVLYAMCTGRPPFSGSGALATLKHVCEEEPPDIRTINPEVPDWLVAIVGRLHAKERGARFASAAEVAELLGKHLAHLQQPAVAPMPPPLGGTHRSRSPIVMGFAAAAPLLLVGGLAITEATGVTKLLAALLSSREPEHKPFVKPDGPRPPTDTTLSLLDKLGPDAIPPAERFDWHPKELVAVLGEHRGRHSSQIRAVVCSPDGKLVASAGLGTFRFDATASSNHPVIVADADTLRTRCVLSGHTGAIFSLSFAPDSRRLISGSYDGTVRVWDVETRKEQLVFGAKRFAVFGVCFSPDGHKALSAEYGGAVRLWNADTGEEIKHLGTHTNWAVAVAFAPDGKHAVSGGGDHLARVWDVDSGQEINRFEHPGVVHTAAFLPDGKRILSGHARRIENHKDVPAPDWDLRLWEWETGKEVRRFSGHKGAVPMLALSSDGQRAITASHDGTVRLWNVEAGAELQSLHGHEGSVWGAALHPGGRWAYSCGDDLRVRQWDLDAGHETSPPMGQRGSAAALAFSPDGRLLLAGGWEDAAVHLWDLETLRERPPWEGHTQGIWALAFSHDSERAFSGSGDGTLRIWNVESGKQVQRCDAHGWVNALAISADSRDLVTAKWSGDQKVSVWDAQRGVERSRVSPIGAAHGIAISRDGRKALTGGAGNTVELWEVNSGDRSRRFDGHTDLVTSVDLAPDGKLAASCGHDGTVWLWSLTNPDQPGRQLVKSTAHFRCVAFAPDSRTLASCDRSGRVILWDVATGARRDWQFPWWVNWLAWAPDGRHLAVASRNGLIYILRVAAAGRT